MNASTGGQAWTSNGWHRVALPRHEPKQPQPRDAMPDMILEKRRLDPAAVSGTVDLLQKPWRWHPGDRLPAEQLLDHEVV